MNEAGKCRVMGELVVLDGIGAAEAIGIKLKAAGFEFVITDDEDGQEPTAFMMIWKDFSDEDADPDKFSTAVDAIAQDQIDCVGFVAPDHVPVRFGDYGVGYQ